MTGYSRAGAEEADFSLSMRIKSTNHRYLDLRVALPAGLEVLEPALRQQLKAEIARGHVEVEVSLRGGETGELPLDRAKLEAYLRTCQRLRGDFGISSEPDVVALLRIPGIITVSNGDPSPEWLERIRPVLERLTAEALRNLNQMRLTEGAALEQDLRRRLERLGVLSREVQQLAERAPDLFFRRLQTRLGAMLANVEMDPDRLAQEVVLLVLRSDIAEELTRLDSHLGQALDLLDRSAEVGKKLDFLLQEMNREANTLLSKTTDVPEVGIEIGRRAIEMKTEIEKLREQAQNLE